MNGLSLWVVDKRARKVFKHSASEVFEGLFTLHSDNNDPPHAITADGAYFWIVGESKSMKKDEAVYRYDTSGNFSGTHFNLKGPTATP